MSKFKNFLICATFISYLGGCAQGGGSGSDDSSGFGVAPRGDGTALVSWTPPTENSDGSPLIDLAGFKIRYGTSPGNYSETLTINNPGLSSYLVENLGVADWYFVMTAFNLSGIESSYSTEVYKAIN